jgi:hypothetical protein
LASYNSAHFKAVFFKDSNFNFKITPFLINFKNDLLNLWDEVLYCDFDTVKGTKYEDKYTNVNRWERLSYDKLKDNRNNLNSIIKKDSDNIKNQNSKLISSKVAFLNMETSGINPLYIGLKKGVCTNDKLDINSVLS